MHNYWIIDDCEKVAEAIAKWIKDKLNGLSYFDATSVHIVASEEVQNYMFFHPQHASMFVFDFEIESIFSNVANCRLYFLKNVHVKTRN